MKRDAVHGTRQLVYYRTPINSRDDFAFNVCIATNANVRPPEHRRDGRANGKRAERHVGSHEPMAKPLRQFRMAAETSLSLLYAADGNY